MVSAHQVEKKIPLTILEENVNGKSIQFVVESDTPLESCLEALRLITEYVEKMKKELEEKAAEEAKKSEELPVMDVIV